MEYVAANLSAQRALLGAITPNLRAVYAEQEPNSRACLHFFYDKPPTEEEEELASIAHTEFFSDFWEEDPAFKISVLPYPNLLPQNNWRVYWRYEPTPD